MGAPTLWWTPRGATSVQSITLPRTTNLIDLPTREITTVRPVGGIPQSTNLGARRAIQWSIEKLGSASHATLIRQLQSLDSHLRMRLPVSLCLDADKAVAYAVSLCNHGDLTAAITSATSLGAAFNSSAALSSDDEITIEDFNPDQRRQFSTFSSLSGLRVTMGTASAYSFGSALLRYRDFYPILRMADPAQGNWLTHYHRLHYTLNLTLEETPGELQALLAIADQIAGADNPTDRGGLTLDGLLGGKRDFITGTEQVFEPYQTIGRLPSDADPWWGGS